MEDLTLEEAKQLLLFYKQRAADLEFQNLIMQLKISKPANAGEDVAVNTKANKTKP